MKLASRFPRVPRRGEPKVDARLKVFAVLATAPPFTECGFNIAKRTGSTSGVMYPLLADMESAGLIQNVLEQGTPVDYGRPLRRLWALTYLGHDAAKKALAEHEAWTELLRGGLFRQPVS